MFIRVRDPETRHEFDIHEDSPLLAKGLVKPVKQDRFPPVHIPRRPKHYVNLAAKWTVTLAKPSGEAETDQEGVGQNG